MSSKKSVAPAEAAAEGVAEATESARAAADEVIEGGKEAARDTLALTQASTEKVQKAAARDYDDLVNLQKANFEAAVKAGTIMAKGYDAIGKEMAAFTQSTLESNFAALQAVLAAATLREAVDLQREHIRKALDQAVAENGKLGEMSMKLASEAITPLQARMNATVEQFVKPLAA